MSDVFAGLEPKFAEAAKAVLAECRERGVIMHPYSGVRTPRQQAATYMQGRRDADRWAAVKRFENAGAMYLASIMRAIGPIAGRKVTNALPGFSWHNFGEALDCGWLKNGKAIEWNDLSGYKVYADVARKHGLLPGATFGDYPHIQYRKESSPLRCPEFFQVVSADGKRITQREPLKAIDEIMKTKFAS